jgi:hypothetical protein
VIQLVKAHAVAEKEIALPFTNAQEHRLSNLRAFQALTCNQGKKQTKKTGFYGLNHIYLLSTN